MYFYLIRNPEVYKNICSEIGTTAFNMLQYKKYHHHHFRQYFYWGFTIAPVKQKYPILIPIFER